MLFWAILTFLVALASAVVTIPFVRHYERRTGTGNIAILKAQLADLERQQAAGDISAEEAGSVRTEIERRILVEGRAGETERPMPLRRRAVTGVGAAAAIAALSVSVYALIGSPGLVEPTGTTTAPRATDNATDELPAIISQLEARVADSPDDVEGWRFLGQTRFRAGDYKGAADAYRKARALAPRNGDHASGLGEALVMAEEGQVTPEAVSVLEEARHLNPKDMRARYYLALAKDQAGDTKGALDGWIAILNESPADAPWVPLVRDTATNRAKAEGIDIAGRIHMQPPAAGPDEEQIRAMEALPPEEQDAMIRTMVEQLAERLEQAPRNEEGWVRLMQVRMVLKDRAGANAALEKAMQAFADTPDAQQRLQRAAKELGVTG